DPETYNWLIYTTAYDNLGRVISKSDPLGHTTTYAYEDVNGRSVTVTEPDPNPYGSPDSAVTVQNYNARGLLESLIDPDNNTTTWAYDGAGRVASETNALDKSRTYQYDGVGNLVHRVDRLGRIINYEYDKANRNTYEKWYNGTTLVRTISFS